MKRIRIIAVCMSLSATLSMVGCMCTPSYYSGAQRHGYGYGHCSTNSFGCDTGCDPCGGAEAHCGGVIEYGGNFCAPPRVANCRHSLSNVGNGICLVGRGLLDITAAPFVAIGGILSSGCRYEVIAHCDNNVVCYPVQTISEPCGSVGTSGCETCADGYTEGIQYNTSAISRPVTFQPVAQPHRSGVVQASYVEPTAPVIRFVQPR